MQVICNYGDSVQFNNDGQGDWRTGTIIGRSMENGVGPFVWIEMFDGMRVMVLESNVITWSVPFPKYSQFPN